MKFKSHLIKNILNNEGNVIENTIRSIHPSEKVVIAQGYGANAQVPRRFLAYAVPVLRLASQMSEKTAVEFYFATHGVYRANGEYYNESLSLMRNELSWFVNKFYPKLNDRVSILEDIPLSDKVKDLITVLFPLARKVIDVNSSIKQFVLNRGGDNALLYMLEHLLYMRDPILVDGKVNTELLVPQMAIDSRHVIMIGGPAEKVFWKFRQEMLNVCGSHTEWKSYQFFTQIGDPPTYHVHSGEPVMDGSSLDNELFSSLRRIPSEFSKQKNLIRDYSVLLQEFAGVETFKLHNEVDPLILKQGEEVFNRYSSLGAY